MSPTDHLSSLRLICKLLKQYIIIYEMVAVVLSCYIVLPTCIIYKLRIIHIIHIHIMGSA